MALGLGGLAALYNYGLQDQIAEKATANSVCRTVSGNSTSFSKHFFSRFYAFQINVKSSFEAHIYNPYTYYNEFMASIMILFS